jgi:hypothetical protein
VWLRDGCRVRAIEKFNKYQVSPKRCKLNFSSRNTNHAKNQTFDVKTWHTG